RRDSRTRKGIPHRQIRSFWQPLASWKSEGISICFTRCRFLLVASIHRNESLCDFCAFRDVRETALFHNDPIFGFDVVRLLRDRRDGRAFDLSRSSGDDAEWTKVRPEGAGPHPAAYKALRK